MQLKCSHWAEKGEDGRLYAANYRGADSSTRPVLMSKPAGHLTSTKCNWSLMQEREANDARRVEEKAEEVAAHSGEYTYQVTDLCRKHARLDLALLYTY